MCTGETVEGSVKGAADTMQQLGIPHTYYSSADQLQERWPHMVPQPQYEGVHEATAGRVNASLACKTMAQLAVGAGWQLQEGVAVEDIVVKGPAHIELITSSGQVVVAKKLVLCAGAWTNQLLQLLGYEMDLEIHSVAWGHWEVTPEAAQQLPQWFCFNKTAAGASADSKADPSAAGSPGQDSAAAWDGGLYYAFPPESPDEHKIKVCATGVAGGKHGQAEQMHGDRLNHSILTWAHHLPLQLVVMSLSMPYSADGAATCMHKHTPTHTIAPQLPN
jgi:glycine/D-amino acid oxidase-like deaminating enzyme